MLAAYLTVRGRISTRHNEAMMITKYIYGAYRFYRDGFRQMTWGRTLWVIILLKLFVMFVILKLFFFPSFLRGKSEIEKQQYVGDELVNRASHQNPRE